jgi:hypothetical protein
MNKVPGIVTVCSCAGHGEDAFRIWFQADKIECLPDLLYWFDNCHSGCPGWKVVVYTDCGKSPATFMVEGPVGEQAFKDAEKPRRLPNLSPRINHKKLYQESEERRKI